jgi:hypothetical protein
VAVTSGRPSLPRGNPGGALGVLDEAVSPEFDLRMKLLHDIF